MPEVDPADPAITATVDLPAERQLCVPQDLHQARLESRVGRCVPEPPGFQVLTQPGDTVATAGSEVVEQFGQSPARQESGGPQALGQTLRPTEAVHGEQLHRQQLRSNDRHTVEHGDPALRQPSHPMHDRQVGPAPGRCGSDRMHREERAASEAPTGSCRVVGEPGPGTGVQDGDHHRLRLGRRRTVEPQDLVARTVPSRALRQLPDVADVGAGRTQLATSHDSVLGRCEFAGDRVGRRWSFHRLTLGPTTPPGNGDRSPSTACSR